jgi:ATP-dependent exoDNAse (exonuclease V) alpha subunit
MLLTQYYAMLQRNLVCTSLTRGKQLVVLVSPKKTLAIAKKNYLNRKNNTWWTGSCLPQSMAHTPVKQL